MMISCLENLGYVVEECQRLNALVALCVGCFDLLHAGHIHLFQEARRALDSLAIERGVQDARLVVALNSDRTVRALKGPGRPIYPLEQRAALLSALAVVDHVVSFGENPAEVICALNPQLYVKADEPSLDLWAERGLVEEYGGQILIVPRVPHISTTDTVFRLRMN